MISSVIQFIRSVERNLKLWPADSRPWFRGESGKDKPLTPKVAGLTPEKELYLLQSFPAKGRWTSQYTET